MYLKQVTADYSPNITIDVVANGDRVEVRFGDKGDVFLSLSPHEASRLRGGLTAVLAYLEGGEPR